jgi:hypothetical protein
VRSDGPQPNAGRDAGAVLPSQHAARTRCGNDSLPWRHSTNDVAHSRQYKFAQSGPIQFVIQHGPHSIGALHSHGMVEDLFRALA